MSSLNSFKTGDTVSVRGLLFNTVGCLVPLSPYILTSQVHSAFLLSIEVTLVALLFSASSKPVSLEPRLIGALAAGAAYLIARWIS